MTDALTLSTVIVQVNEARLFDKPLSAARTRAMAAFLAKRQGLSGGYGQLFAPVDDELTDGYWFFTGERITTRAGSTHIIGEESLRALILLRPQTKSGKEAIQRAATWMSQRLEESETTHGGGLRNRGLYCCMRCSVAVWRVMAFGGIDQSADRLRCGLRILRSRRDGAGAWRSYPFHYTLSALLDAHTEEADRELRYARPAIERRLARAAKNSSDAYVRRRRRLLELTVERT